MNIFGEVKVLLILFSSKLLILDWPLLWSEEYHSLSNRVCNIKIINLKCWNYNKQQMICKKISYILKRSTTCRYKVDIWHHRKQEYNCWIRSLENPHEAHRKWIHPQWVTMLCGFLFGEIISSFFLNGAGTAISFGRSFDMNWKIGTSMICGSNIMVPCQVAGENPTFLKSWISSWSEVKWLDRSCD